MKKSILYILVSVLAVIIFSGCSSKAVKHDVKEVKIDKTPLPTAVVEKKLQYPDKDFIIHPEAYNHFINGLLLIENGNLESAAESFKRALQYHPNSYELRYSLADCYFQLREYENTIEVLKVISPVDIPVLQLIGSSYLNLGKIELAADAYHEIIEIDPDNSLAYSYLLGIYNHLGETDSLVWTYENLSRLNPDNVKALRELGRMYAQKGDYEKSKEMFRKSIEIVPGESNLIAYLSLSEVYELLNKPDSSLMVLEEALHFAPEDYSINRDIATFYLKQDSLEASLPYARKASLLKPEDRFTSRRLAIIYYGLDSLNKSDSILTSLVNRGDENYLNHYYLGRIAVLQENFEIAIDEFTILTQMEDTLADSWFDLAFAYRQNKQPDMEIETYKKGLNNITDQDQAVRLMFALGATYEQNDKPEMAKDIFEKIIKKIPNHAQSLNYLGYMLAVEGTQLDYAKELVERALKEDPENAAYLDSYGWVLYQLGQYDKAKNYLEKASTLGTDPEIYEHMGDVYEALGDNDEAVKWWEKALELDPKREEIKHKIGR